MNLHIMLQSRMGAGNLPAGIPHLLAAIKAAQ